MIFGLNFEQILKKYFIVYVLHATFFMIHLWMREKCTPAVPIDQACLQQRFFTVTSNVTRSSWKYCKFLIVHLSRAVNCFLLFFFKSAFLLAVNLISTEIYQKEFLECFSKIYNITIKHFFFQICNFSFVLRENIKLSYMIIFYISWKAERFWYFFNILKLHLWKMSPHLHSDRKKSIKWYFFIAIHFNRHKNYFVLYHGKLNQKTKNIPLDVIFKYKFQHYFIAQNIL